jgi:HlyD family secretion protein
MEPADKPPLNPQLGDLKHGTVLDFLPDADEIERSPMPPYLRTTVFALAAAVFLFITWATFSEVERIVVTQGRLVNPLPNIVVQPLETSIIQRIEVRTGQVVRKGEVLATLDPTFAQADEAQLRTRLRSLDTQTRGLSEELSGRKGGATGGGADAQLQAQLSSERQANYQAQISKMDQNLARLAASLQTNRRDQDVLGQRMKSLLEMEAMQETLMAQQFGARLQLLEARDRRLNGERELEMARNREQEIRREMAALESEKMAFVKGWRQKMMEDLLSTSRDRDGINEQLQKADKRKELVSLVAPADAVVLEIAKLSQGSVVQAAEKMFTLVPLGDDMEVEVSVDAADIGYVKVGDKAHIKFDAFPYQKHGMLDGTLRTLSEDAFRRDAGATSGALDAFYVSRIRLGTGRLHNMGAGMRLLPGMTVSAEIVVGKRSVISYLIWPLTKAMDEAIREP